MTGNTRNYLADLALKKGVSVGDFENATQAAASKKIDELQRLPDASFAPVSIKEQERVIKKIDKVIAEIMKWTLTD